MRVALLTLALAACGRPDITSADIRAAMPAIRTALSQAFERDLVSADDCQGPCGLSVTFAATDIVDPAVEGLASCFGPCRVDVRSDTPPTYLNVILVHEIGHIIGLEHSEDPGDVMYRYANPGLSLMAMAGQLATACSRQHCQQRIHPEYEQ